MSFSNDPEKKLHWKKLEPDQLCTVIEGGDYGKIVAVLEWIEGHFGKSWARVEFAVEDGGHEKIIRTSHLRPWESVESASGVSKAVAG